MEVTPGHGVRVERRAAGLTGRKPFVSIHTRSVVARDPPPEVYRAARDARKTLIMSDMIRSGKGLKLNID